MPFNSLGYMGPGAQILKGWSPGVVQRPLHTMSVAAWSGPGNSQEEFLYSSCLSQLSNLRLRAIGPQLTNIVFIPEIAVEDDSG